MAIINANGADFYYELHGEGQPLVLISGFKGDHTFWLPILKGLSERYQVLIFDNRGAGQTRDDGASLTAESMAEDVMALCGKLGIQNPHIIGQSMGGTIAQTIAAKYPDKINKLGILSSTSKWRAAMLMAFELFLSMRKNNLDANLIFDAKLPWLFGQEFLSAKENITLCKEMMLNDPFPQTLANQERQMQVLRQFDGEEQLKYIKASTLIICGNQDIIALPAESHFIANHIPNSQLVTLDCAHGLVPEVPQQLLDVLTRII